MTKERRTHLVAWGEWLATVPPSDLDRYRSEIATVVDEITTELRVPSELRMTRSDPTVALVRAFGHFSAALAAA